MLQTKDSWIGGESICVRFQPSQSWTKHSFLSSNSGKRQLPFVQLWAQSISFFKAISSGPKTGMLFNDDWTIFDLGTPPYYPGDDCGAGAGVLRSRRWLWHRGHGRLAHHDRLPQVNFLSRKIHQNCSRTLNLTFERMPTHELISENGRVVLSGLKYLKSNSVNKQWAKSFSFLWSDAFQP